MAQQGYALAFNNEQLQQASGKTLGLFANFGMQDGIVETQFKDDAKREQPTLKDMSAQALKILERNERGFFLMIEAGQLIGHLIEMIPVCCCMKC